MNKQATCSFYECNCIDSWKHWNMFKTHSFEELGSRNCLEKLRMTLHPQELLNTDSMCSILHKEKAQYRAFIASYHIPQYYQQFLHSYNPMSLFFSSPAPITCTTTPTRTETSIKRTCTCSRWCYVKLQTKFKGVGLRVEHEDKFLPKCQDDWLDHTNFKLIFHRLNTVLVL